MIQNRRYHISKKNFLARCGDCQGRKLVEVKEVIHVTIEKGMKDGDQIRYMKMGEQPAGAIPGDLLVILQEEKDANFQRRGNDLVYRHRLSLSEALTGYEFALSHLDGRKLILRSNPREMVTPGECRMINEEGMPIHKNPSERGKMFVILDVEFPTKQQMQSMDQRMLESLLPPKPKLPEFAMGESVEEVKTVRVEIDASCLAAEPSNGRGVSSGTSATTSTIGMNGHRDNTNSTNNVNNESQCHYQ
eukprot:TRINITY_DN242_c1_g1_i3.p1 TRINITY_DN242_c1_g1~~TRINITY_DN242_c1_g1_i3.p1  ORF type:complete len:247 (+),score=42.15 TRINITY_DN242_c1_g1_i3:140-880(+)